MAHKLQGKMEWMGLPISIENRKGSSRHWHDPHSGESGSTKMKHPYGYIRGTLGTDGDEVDVYVGPEENGKIFVITQMKAPDFKEIDEQKVMLGFQSAADAKKTYLDHYDDNRFFGSIKELDLENFKEKLISNKGKLIKHLFLADSSANIQAMDKSQEQKSLGCDHPTDELCKNCGGDHVSKSATDIFKGLTARMLSMMVKRAKASEARPEVPEAEHQPRELMGPEVGRSLYRNRPWEQPMAPVVQVRTPIPTASPNAPDFMTSCGGCGYTHKSLSECPRCAQIHKSNVETKPIWRR